MRSDDRIDAFYGHDYQVCPCFRNKIEDRFRCWAKASFEVNLVAQPRALGDVLLDPEFKWFRDTLPLFLLGCRSGHILASVHYRQIGGKEVG
jgi:hypothetical protein